MLYYSSTDQLIEQAYLVNAVICSTKLATK